MRKMVVDKTITVQHVMEVVLVSLAELADFMEPTSESKITVLLLRRFSVNLDIFTNEVIIDPNTLQRRYFKEKEEKMMELERDEKKESGRRRIERKRTSRR